jgi:hypothetical protein
VLHGAKLAANGQWSSAFVWGANKIDGHAVTHSVLAESEAILDASNTLMGRAEWVQKSAEDLVLDLPPTSIVPNHTFAVSALSLGYIREMGRWNGATIGIGAMGTVNLVPDELRRSYGSRTPVGGLLFLRVRPRFATAGDMSTMRHEGASPRSFE